jgi:hypothetical protein
MADAKLGNPANLIKASADRARTIGIKANVARATKRLVALEPVIRAIEGDGKTLPSQIATELNKKLVPAPRGGKWSTAQVSRVLSRMAAP